MRLKFPSQPLVFSFFGVSALCDAVSALYDRYPRLSASLCLSGGIYYLAAHTSLSARKSVYCTLSEYGNFLGPGSVLYAFHEEHGKSISRNAVAELGAALRS